MCVKGEGLTSFSSMEVSSGGHVSFMTSELSSRTTALISSSVGGMD